MGFLDEDGLISKTRSMVLSLSNIISRSPTLSPMQVHECQCTASIHKQYLHLPGLKTLIYEYKSLQLLTPTLIIHSYTIPQSPSPPSLDFMSFRTHSASYSSWSSGMDDMLGTESGVYMIHSALKMITMDHKAKGPSKQRNKRKQGRPRVGEYPPPIPLLARTGNLPSHMPWILARYYSNGRLVLKEEKVKHHEYFEAYRENGRLILDLVPLDGSFRCCHTVFEETNAVEDDEEKEIELENLEFFQGYGELEKVEELDEETDDNDDDDDDEDNGNVKHEASMTSALSVPEMCHWSETYGDPRKCLTYSGRFISEMNSVLSQC
ncbi:hypothetical protein E1A91_D05G246500v1 [Gossypium mustelinum]|uniref:FAF domain-containing protein n=1 Tax=Gossypium mustelinum TaxID=34275 RepID=A0A5D2V0D1_GOSMU|nr:hypothetical protein E1A91_D05G246500v1 [Gossypium mustelinum]